MLLQNYRENCIYLALLGLSKAPVTLQGTWARRFTFQYLTNVFAYSFFLKYAKFLQGKM